MYVCCKIFAHSEKGVVLSTAATIAAVNFFIVRSAKRRYLSYSLGDFEVFHPAGATRFTNRGEIGTVEWTKGRECPFISCLYLASLIRRKAHCSPSTCASFGYLNFWRLKRLTSSFTDCNILSRFCLTRLPSVQDRSLCIFRRRDRTVHFIH